MALRTKEPNAPGFRAGQELSEYYVPATLAWTAPCGCIYANNGHFDYLSLECKAHKAIQRAIDERGKMARELMPANPKKQAKVNGHGRYEINPNVPKSYQHLR